MALWQEQMSLILMPSSFTQSYFKFDRFVSESRKLPHVKESPLCSSLLLGKTNQDGIYSLKHFKYNYLKLSAWRLERWKLRTLAALPEDPSTHPVVHNSSPRGFAAFFRQRQAMPTRNPWTYKQMPIHVKYYSKKCKNLSIGNKVAQARKDSSVGKLPGLANMMFVFYSQNLCK